MDLEAVIALARRAHAGQVDRLGRDYFTAHLSPIAAGASLFGPTVEAAAWLHDVIEDTGMTAEQLLAEGVDPEVVAAIESVSRRTGADGRIEPYEELIRRASAHPVGRLVKLVDNAWNLASNPELATVDPEKARELREERYLPARDRLLASIGINACWLGYLELRRVLDGEREALLAG